MQIQLQNNPRPMRQPPGAEAATFLRRLPLPKDTLHDTSTPHLMKTIVITGASDGIGAEVARQLATTHGTQVALVLAARNEALLDRVAGYCAAHGAQTLVVKTDVSQQAQCRRLIAAT